MGKMEVGPKIEMQSTSRSVRGPWDLLGTL